MGTNALEMNENGTARMLSPCAACALPLTSPSNTNTNAKDSAYTTSSPMREHEVGDRACCIRKPMMKPTPSVTSPTSTMSAASAIARPGEHRADRRSGSDRNRSYRPDATSSATATDRPAAGEEQAGHDEPGDEELDVGDAAHADRAAEDVAEHQQEHDALHDGDAEHLRCAQQLAAWCGRRR